MNQLKTNSKHFIIHNILDIHNSLLNYCYSSINTTSTTTTANTNNNDMKSIDNSTSSIIVRNGSNNDINYKLFYYSELNHIESIEIGDYCFGSVKTFRIDRLNGLKTIKIGNNSFTQVKSTDKWIREKVNNQWKSFHILNCESLESIQIGEYIFSDFGGEFELKNLPQLQSIQIGTIGILSSSNFYCSSFVLRGIELILNIVMNRSSKSTIHHIGRLRIL